MMKKDHSRSERIFRALLRLFPFDFRWKHGREMEQMFRQRRKGEERQGGKMGTLKLWWETLADIARTAPREHLEMLAQDAGYALRLMRKNLGFTTVAVLTLALGIGANTAIFSVVEGILLRPLPYEDPAQLVMVWETHLKKGWHQGSVSLPNFADWRDRSQAFEGMAAFTTGGASLTGGNRPERVTFADVTYGFFGTLKARPVLGRKFLPEEDQPGGEPVIIISHGLWQRNFAEDPNIVGKKLVINANPYTVVGVMPGDFDFPVGTDLWSPLARNPRPETRRRQYLLVLARLKLGITRQQAQTDMDKIASQLAEEYPVENSGWGANVVPLMEQTVGSIRTPLLVLLGAVGFVLLIACANVANLLLSRATQREKEIAIRAALGASRWRLIRQLITESILLAVTGGSLGVGLSFGAVNTLRVLDPGNLPRLDGVAINEQALAFTLFFSLLTGLLFGLLPALETSRTDLQSTLKEGGWQSSGTSRHRLRSVLVVAEVALALVLLVGAGLLLRSFGKLMRVDPGFNPTNLFTFRTFLPSARYSGLAEQSYFYNELLQKMRAFPGVEEVASAQTLPLDRAGNSIAIAKEGEPFLHPDGSFVSGMYRTVSANYHRAMGTPLLRGRYFTEQDAAESEPVVIINQTMARRDWPDEDPLGKRFSISAADNPPVRTIVGIVSDIRHFGLEAPYRPEMFVPQPQAATWTQQSLAIVIRSTADPAALLAAGRRAIQSLDPELPVYGARSMDGIFSNSVAQRRFTLLLLGSFASLALVLAAIGIYGVISYSVSQRTHEIGIRMVLGAQPRNVLRMVVGQGMLLTLIGVAVGLAGAFALTRFLSSLLFGVAPTDPLTFGGVAVLLTGVALLACYIPARRATKVDPMVALRYE